MCNPPRTEQNNKSFLILKLVKKDRLLGYNLICLILVNLCYGCNCIISHSLTNCNQKPDNFSNCNSSSSSKGCSSELLPYTSNSSSSRFITRILKTRIWSTIKLSGSIIILDVGFSTNNMFVTFLLHLLTPLARKGFLLFSLAISIIVGSFRHTPQLHGNLCIVYIIRTYVHLYCESLKKSRILS